MWRKNFKSLLWFFVESVCQISNRSCGRVHLYEIMREPVWFYKIKKIIKSDYCCMTSMKNDERQAKVDKKSVREFGWSVLRSGKRSLAVFTLHLRCGEKFLATLESFIERIDFCVSFYIITTLCNRKGKYHHRFFMFLVVFERDS